MYSRIFEAWQRIFASFPPPGPAVMELGAAGDPQNCLLTPLHRARPDGRYVGVNLGTTAPATPARPYEMVAANANDLSVFGGGTFDAVITNAMLEHDRAFWRTLAEVRRVLRPGGLFYVGVPGYATKEPPAHQAVARLCDSRVGRVPVVGDALRRARHSRLQATRTFMFHAAPDDYWRFSEEAVRQVLLEGMDCLFFEQLLEPVRFLAVGRTPE